VNAKFDPINGALERVFTTRIGLDILAFAQTPSVVVGRLLSVIAQNVGRSRSLGAKSSTSTSSRYAMKNCRTGLYQLPRAEGELFPLDRNQRQA
jgi:hypothetical protein